LDRLDAYRKKQEKVRFEFWKKRGRWQFNGHSAYRFNRAHLGIGGGLSPNDRILTVVELNFFFWSIELQYDLHPEYDQIDKERERERVAFQAKMTAVLKAESEDQTTELNSEERREVIAEMTRLIETCDVLGCHVCMRRANVARKLKATT
jgi:hypothetical protein